jgi:hypothetical protein
MIGGGKAIPVQARTGPLDPRIWKLSDFKTMKMVRLSVLSTGHLYPLENIPGTQCFGGLNRPQGHSPPRRFMKIKNSTNKIGNRNRDLPACSAVAQPTAPPRANASNHSNVKFRFR